MFCIQLISSSFVSFTQKSVFASLTFHKMNKSFPKWLCYGQPITFCTDVSHISGLPSLGYLTLTLRKTIPVSYTHLSQESASLPVQPTC